MPTKENPGTFRCYEAALPDEPIFTILGRDPAGPATLLYWANQRHLLGKGASKDDLDRIAAAREEAGEMKDWRARMLESSGDGEPGWRLPRHFVDEGTPVRDLPEYRYEGPAFWREQPCHPLSVTKIVERLDYATSYGEFDEYTPAGTETEILGASDPMTDFRRGVIWAYKKVLGLIDDGIAPPSYSTLSPPKPYPKADGGPVSTINGEPVKQPIIDTDPNDLAHAPEVPYHRFSAFHVDGDYAYARGLEVAPMHLPVALSAMARSGWHLVSIFGATDSKHVGFIFRREMPPMTYIPASFDMTAQTLERSAKHDPLMTAFQSGTPLADIETMADRGCLDIGYGRGQEP